MLKSVLKAFGRKITVQSEEKTQAILVAPAPSGLVQHCPLVGIVRTAP